MGVLNPSQLEIIKLFESHKTEEDLKKLKRALIQYLYERAAEAADTAFDERGYTQDTVEQWKAEKTQSNSNLTMKVSSQILIDDYVNDSELIAFN